MNIEHSRAWTALHRTPNLTENSLRLLMSAVADPVQIFSLSQQELKELGIAKLSQLKLTHPDSVTNKELKQQLETDWRLIEELQIQVVPLNSDLYPELLKQINDPPPLLYIRGNVSLLDQPQLAMVGSRKPTRQGADNAFRLAKELASAGFTITSGLALGIDAQSHQGAIAASGSTVAVLGTGVDKTYPASNRSLFRHIEQIGAIISEFPLGSGPLRGHFPKRNRIISGLSLGVLVVEAAKQSGSLISARCAMEQNREVFAIPGSIHSPVSQGCHQLLRQGAKLVETASDIVEELGGWSLQAGSQQPALSSENLAPDETELLEILGYDPTPINLLQQRCSWPVAKLSSLLTTLELRGLIENMAGTYQRVP
jgi:DNA processing protein